MWTYLNNPVPFGRRGGSQIRSKGAQFVTQISLAAARGGRATQVTFFQLGEPLRKYSILSR